MTNPIRDIDQRPHRVVRHPAHSQNRVEACHPQAGAARPSAPSEPGLITRYPATTEMIPTVNQITA
jgi:hypothetical protein